MAAQREGRAAGEAGSKGISGASCENRQITGNGKEKEEMKKAKRAYKAAGLILALTVLLAGAGCAGKPSEERDGADLIATDGALVIDGEGNALLTDGTGQKMPRQMIFSLSEVQEAESEAEAVSEAGIAAQSLATSVTVTATISPSYAADKSVDWGVAFADGTTSSAATDYIQVTPTTDGALTATVTCLKAFSKKILITATSRSNPDVADSCEVDYLQRASGATVYLGNNVMTYSASGTSTSALNVVIGLLGDSGATGGTVRIGGYGGVGTITQTFTTTVQYVGSKTFMSSSFAPDGTFTYKYWISLPTVTLTTQTEFSFGRTSLNALGATLNRQISGSTNTTTEALSALTSSIAEKMWSATPTPRSIGSIVVTVSGDKDAQYGLSAKTWTTSIFASSYV